MPFETLNLGLSLELPTNGTTNWGTYIKNTTWKKISQHTHTGSGDGNQIPTAGIVDGAVTSAKLATSIALWKQAATLTPTGTAQTVDFNNGNVQFLDLGSATGDVTLTLSNPAAGAEYLLLVTQGATPRDLIWPATLRWPQSQKPILSQANGAVDKIRLYYDGSVYRGDWDLDYSV